MSSFLKPSPRLFIRGLVAVGVALLLSIPVCYFLFFVKVTNPGLSFSRPLAIPALLEPEIINGEKVFDLIPAETTTALLGEEPTRTMGYNQSYLGPTIRVNRGDPFVARVTNALDVDTTVHWHGMHVPPEMDGTPHQNIAPGDTWISRFPILNEASTMWYHPHPHGQTAEQVFRGLVGLFLIEDENSQSLGLPRTYGVDDIPLVIQERMFDDDGDLHYELNKGAYYGDTMLVNGTFDPFVAVPAGLVRFRLLNGSNARTYHFGFGDDREFHQIATDGGLLEAPVPVQRIKLSPGERAEIVIDFSDGNPVVLKSFPENGLIETAEAVLADLIGNGHFEILRIVPDTTIKPASVAALPAKLNEIKRWDPAEADKVRRMVLGGPVREGPRMPGPGPRIPINGRLMDMARVDEIVCLNDIEIWEIVNRGGQPHPFHIHDVQFLILDRNGVPPAPTEAGWKDTVMVETNETLRFITQFTTYSSTHVPYMYHCHILEHEDGGMMGQFLVVDMECDLDAPIVLPGITHDH
ncbi:MAG: multicopper oxidase domain-containing protein [Synoicihabitans sp.]